MHLKLIVTLSLRSFLSSLLFSFWLDIIWNALGMFFCNSLYVGTYYGEFLESFTTYHLSSTCIQTSSLGFCRKIILCDLEAQIFLSYGMQSLFLFLSPFISLSFFFFKKTLCWFSFAGKKFDFDKCFATHEMMKHVLKVLQTWVCQFCCT